MTSDTKLSFVITFNTSEGKKKSMSFNHAGSYSSVLKQRLINIANSFVTNTAAFKDTLTSVDALTHKVTTTHTFSEAE